MTDKGNLDAIPEYDTSSAEHPTPEQLLLRMAVERALMNKQRKVWEWHNYDRLTAVEIAKKLKIDPSSAARQIKTIEKQLAKWCTDHKEVYDAIKEAETNDSENSGC